MRKEDLLSKEIGLVLSGGGVKGIAHIGLIKALIEHGIEPKVVSGTSVGALVGALYANGSSIDQMLLFFKETPLSKPCQENYMSPQQIYKMVNRPCSLKVNWLPNYWPRPHYLRFLAPLKYRANCMPMEAL